MRDRLYEVTIRVVGYVLVEHERQAIYEAKDIVKDAYLQDCAEAIEVTKGHPMDAGWDDDSLVYGTEADTLLGSVWPR